MKDSQMQAEVNVTLPDCPTGTLYAWTPHGVHLAPAWCKRWACNECGPRKAHKLAKRIMQTSGRRFITLTVRPDPTRSPAELLDLLSQSWRTVWKRIRRLHGIRARGYVRIVEVTKLGTPHLHIAADCPYVPQRQLSRWWAQLTGSPIVDIRAIKTTSGMSRYLTKYLTKAHDVILHRRKWSQTSAFLPPADKPPPKPSEDADAWHWLKATLDNVHQAFEAAGWTIVANPAATPTAPPP